MTRISINMPKNYMFKHFLDLKTGLYIENKRRCHLLHTRKIHVSLEICCSNVVVLSNIFQLQNGIDFELLKFLLILHNFQLF